jgi:hypothetical protein
MGVRRMIANLLNILVGLWLAYSAIFATPAGNMNSAALAGSAVAAIVFAVWARQSDHMRWPSASNIVLGAISLATAAAHWLLALAPLVCFWIVLLAGIAIAIMAMWSILYRPGVEAGAA